MRQWVLSFRYHVRFLLAFHPARCSAVRGIFVRTILNWLSERAAAAGAPGGSSGALVLAQQFGGALNVHFHALVLDRVHTSQGLLAAPRFQPAPELRDENVARVTALLHHRIVRYLQRRGRLPRQEQAEHDEPAPDDPLLAFVSAASVEGLVALGPESGQPLTRRGRQRHRRPQYPPGELCCDLEGFSLHAKVAIEGHDRAGLERLCRYIVRPAIASELALARPGRPRGLPPAARLARRHQRDRLRAARVPRAPRGARAQAVSAPLDLPRRARARGAVARGDRAACAGRAARPG